MLQATQFSPPIRLPFDCQLVASHWESLSLLLGVCLDSTVNMPIHLIAGCQYEIANSSQQSYTGYPLNLTTFSYPITSLWQTFMLNVFQRLS